MQRVLIVAALIGAIAAQVAVSMSGDPLAQLTHEHYLKTHPRTQILKSFIREFNKYKNGPTAALIESYFEPTAQIMFPVLSKDESSRIGKEPLANLIRPRRNPIEFAHILQYLTNDPNNFQTIVPRGEFFENEHSNYVCVSMSLLSKFLFRSKVDGFLQVEFNDKNRITKFLFFHVNEYWAMQYVWDAHQGSQLPQMRDSLVYGNYFRAVNKYVMMHDVDRFNVYREGQYAFPTPQETIEWMKPKYVLSRLFPITEHEKKILEDFYIMTPEVQLSIPIGSGWSQGPEKARKFYNKIIGQTERTSVFIDEELVVVENQAAVGLIYNLLLKDTRMVTFKAILFFTLAPGDRFKTFELAFDENQVLSEILGINTGTHVVASSN